jgi:glutathione S-transferase
MQLLTNWFSPFARKSALALDFKGLTYEAMDGLDPANHDTLWRRNPRGEVPTLIDGDLTVSNSSHILAYLEDAFPEKPILPASPHLRAGARALERLYDTRVDAIMADCALWTWAKRADAPPQGMKEAGQQDLSAAFAETEATLPGDTEFSFADTPGLADFALWPHLSAVEPLGFVLDRTAFPKTAALLARMKATDLFRSDAARARTYLKTMAAGSLETTRIAWRGDRIEWLLARGFHDWFLEEIRADRVIWPLLRS